MSAPEFDTAHLKLGRAHEHAVELSRVWNEYLDSEPFDMALISQGENTWVLKVSHEQPIPTRMSLLFGEWLFNLRSALDSLMWATAVHVSRTDPPPSEAQLQYPIFDSLASWERNVYRLRPLAEHHRQMLFHMQPFNTAIPDANFLGWINRLARIDRHRRMTVATAYIAQLEPAVEVPPGGDVRLEWGERVFRDGVCEAFRLIVDRDVQFPPRVNPRLGIDPEIEEWAASDFWRPRRFSERIKMLEIFVRAEIGLYEYDCTGQARGWNGMTESFRNESDERRDKLMSTPISRPDRPEVVWKEETRRRQGTRDRFFGVDFPADGSALPK